MIDKKAKKAIMSIEMDSLSNFEIRFEGDLTLRVSMIGALEFAKDYLKNSIMSGAGVSGAEICRKKETEYTTENTKAVSKEEAISLYLDAYETIKARLSIIAASDDRTEYQVPESLKTL